MALAKKEEAAAASRQKHKSKPAESDGDDKLLEASFPVKGIKGEEQSEE
jgi:hypothetical protein